MSARPIRVVFLLQDLEFGGTQRYALHVLKHLNRNLFQPELWVMRGGEDMVPLAQETGVKIVWLSKSTWVGPVALVNLFHILARSRPDIIYTLTVLPNIWGRAFAAMTRVPAIVSSFRNGVAKQHEKWLWPLSTAIIVNADSLKDLIVRRFGVDPTRVETIPNGVDIDYFFPDYDKADANPTVVSVGRLVEQKDPFNLLEAFRLVIGEIPSARLIMVGNGHLRPAVDEYVRTHGLRSAVEVLRATPDIRPSLRRAWVFAMSSLFEGSPNVLIEAMSSGLPVVATNVDGIPDLVKPDETGLLVPRRDSKALADGLIRLLRDLSACRAMGRAARERVVQHHSLERMVRRTEEVFMNCYRES